MRSKSDKGVAGLTVLLSLIVMLFVIGLLVMIFAIMSGKLANSDSLYYSSGTLTSANESVSLTTAGTDVAVAGYRNVACGLVTVYNGTTVLGSGNVTEISECKFRNNTGYTAWKLTYTYSYDADSSGAVNVINDTSHSIASVTDWFDIFIVIGSMVVLILLTVIIVTAIRSSGMVAGADNSGANKVGTA
jgi:hypothetical protein